MADIVRFFAQSFPHFVPKNVKINPYFAKGYDEYSGRFFVYKKVIAMGQRVIDVVFVHPKNRQLVIWHKGEWWQVTKMQLTDNAWQYKTPYTGSLEEIYVAKEQAVSCQHLAKTLQTHELPSELRSISAAKFLSWWSVNDFDWLNRQNHQSHAMLNNNQAHTPADSTPSDSTANDKT
ncbi:MAG: hypothetical protein Q4G13_08910, partial [Moraxella sp.]|nr:hypothetical protein [Moraxella sp.]